MGSSSPRHAQLVARGPATQVESPVPLRERVLDGADDRLEARAQLRPPLVVAAVPVGHLPGRGQEHLGADRATLGLEGPDPHAPPRHQVGGRLEQHRPDPLGAPAGAQVEHPAVDGERDEGRDRRRDVVARAHQAELRPALGELAAAAAVLAAEVAAPLREPVVVPPARQPHRGRPDELAPECGGGPRPGAGEQRRPRRAGVPAVEEDGARGVRQAPQGIDRGAGDLPFAAGLRQGLHAVAGAQQARDPQPGPGAPLEHRGDADHAIVVVHDHDGQPRPGRGGVPPPGEHPGRRGVGLPPEHGQPIPIIEMGIELLRLGDDDGADHGDPHVRRAGGEVRDGRRHRRRGAERSAKSNDAQTPRSPTARG